MADVSLRQGLRIGDAGGGKVCALIAALNKLNESIVTDGKTPASITAYRNSLTANQATINQAKSQAQAIIANENASQSQVNEALQTVKVAQGKVDEAKNKLVDSANKTSPSS